MIVCKELGDLEITGHLPDILVEYSFITSQLADIAGKKEVVRVFLTGLEADDMINSGRDHEECWDMIDKMVDEAFREEEK